MLVSNVIGIRIIEMKNIICKNTFKEFSSKYLQKKKHDYEETITCTVSFAIALTFLLPIMTFFNVDVELINSYKMSILALACLGTSFVYMLPKSLLVKIMPKTAYLKMISKNSYNGELTDILDVSDEKIRTIISANKERIKFDINKNGCISGRTLAYLMKEINQENIRERIESKFERYNYDSIRNENINQLKIKNLDNY